LILYVVAIADGVYVVGIFGALVTIRRSAYGISAVQTKSIATANSFLVCNVIVLIINLIFGGIYLSYGYAGSTLLLSCVPDIIFFVYFQYRGKALVEILQKRQGIMANPLPY